MKGKLSRFIPKKKLSAALRHIPAFWMCRRSPIWPSSCCPRKSSAKRSTIAGRRASGTPLWFPGIPRGGPGRRGAAKELEAIARRHGIRFLGPNCLGVANLHLKLNPTPIKADCKAGFVGLASQSGSFITQMFNYLHRHGMGFSAALSVGNEASIDIVDCLEYLGACPHTKVITLYIEGINRGSKFVEIAKAITPRKPIVALYVGGSEAGKQAGLSHTGSLSGPNEIYDGIFKQCGIIRAKTLTELFDYALALGTLPRPGETGSSSRRIPAGPAPRRRMPAAAWDSSFRACRPKP